MQRPTVEAEASIPTLKVGEDPTEEAEASISTVNNEEDPTEEAEASIPTVKEEEDANENLNCTFAVRRKAARRTLPWDLAAGELDLVSSQPSSSSSSPPQAEDILDRKKPRLEEPLPTTKDQAVRKTPSPDITVDLSPPAADIDKANADSTMDTQPKAGATRAKGPWTPWKPEDDAKLTTAVTNTPKKKWGKEYKNNWLAIAALLPGRVERQCRNRWDRILDPNSDRATARKGKWGEDEDTKLKNAAQTHGAKDWSAIAVLVPGRTNVQCYNRWQNVLDCSIDRATKCKGRWTAVEDSKLKDAVQTHGEKDWAAIASLVSGRTRQQCYKRWHSFLDPNIDRTKERTGNWEAVEDSKLKDAFQTHGEKNWGAIAPLVPGRTIVQCYNRWYNVLDCSIDRANIRMGKWEEEEVKKLKDAVQTQGDKDWVTISALVPGRTQKQCSNRWQHVLDAKPNRRTGKWAEDEDSKLRDAVQTHGGKDWITISALVPGRTKQQCSSRWTYILQCRADSMSSRKALL
jgi:hypothetical protein